MRDPAFAKAMLDEAATAFFNASAGFKDLDESAQSILPLHEKCLVRARSTRRLTSKS